MTTEKPPLDALQAARETMEKAQKTLGTIDARSEAVEKIEKESPDSLLDKVKNISLAARRINKVWDAAQDLYQRVNPVARLILKPIVWTGGKLIDGFKYAAFEREEGGWGIKRDGDGDPTFSAKRLGKVFALAAMVGFSGIAGMKSAYFHATQFSETVYVTGKQEIEPGDLYQFTGCTSLPCSTENDNGKYYHVEQSWFSPRLIYPEQDVYANIPEQLAACRIDGYGIYFKELRALFRWTELYQHVYDVSCRPLSPEEIQQAMEPPSPEPSPATLDLSANLQPGFYIR